MTEIGIIAIDVVFALAVLTAVSCLAYLVYLTVREHAELKAVRAKRRPPCPTFRSGRSATARKVYGQSPYAATSARRPERRR
jgi:hypothetical protein